MYKYIKLTVLLVSAFIIGGLIPVQSVSAQPLQPEQTTLEQMTTTSEFVKSSLSPVKAKTIVLDPGHCKKHRGASYAGFREEKIVLDIAKACKKELDQYGDINVYMTRTSNACPKNIAPGDCLTARNNYAKLLSSDFLISLHINAKADSSAKTLMPYKSGANVLVPYKSGYHNTVRNKSRKFGSTVLSELQGIGIKSRGFLLRKTKLYRYKNGKRADYYSIVRNGVKLNIPSVIIEHGYIDNESDRNKYFLTKSQRETVATADAKAIISYYNLTAQTISGTFSKIGNDTYYVTNTSQKVTGWVKSDGKWYYFDEITGKIKKGFITIDKNTFYLNPSTGEMTVGWFKVKGSTYLSRGNGTLVKNQKYSDGYYTYHFNKNGKRLKKVSRTQ